MSKKIPNIREYTDIIHTYNSTIRFKGSRGYLFGQWVLGCITNEFGLTKNWSCVDHSD